MPEIAEAGYSALWLPPPSKASGGMSVGYDLWDPFDLGGQDQRGTVRTRYGTEAELLNLVDVAHRFGIRVYFDNIMNHRAFDIPGYDEDTPVDIYPGMLPEDFHLRKTEDGFYRKWDNTRNWQDQWQVQNLGLADLIDIAHENPNTNFGEFEGGSYPKLSFVRDLKRPWQYDRLPNGQYVGFGKNNGITEEIVRNNPEFYREDVNSYLIRAARWFMDKTKADGLRLDAVKHVPSYFFGRQSGWDRDGSNDGYLGGVQWQFNMTRGYSDWNNHRDSVFNHEQGRDDAMVFGEHLGSPPGYDEYISAGMRLVDAPLHRKLNSNLGNPSGTLSGMDSPGWSGDPAFNDSTGIPFAQSHDDDFANRRELQHAYYLTRRGLPNIYTDGYYKAATLGESGGAFPRHANNPFLGQFGDNRIPNLLSINESFSRGSQIARWSDGDVVAYERRDKRENPSMSDADGTVLLFMMNDNYASGQARPIRTSFPAVDGGANAYLHNYSPYGGGFYVWASQISSGNVVIPPGGYFAFSWKNPDPSPQWPGSAITIYENGKEVDKVRVTRKDGPDGDPLFNPYGLPNRGYPSGKTPDPFSYQIEIPRVRDGSNLSFIMAVDGSAENVQFKLGGGVDINSQIGLGPLTGDLRDNPPATTTDTFLGYEQARFIRRTYSEKFAAVNTSRCKTGSRGAETYLFVSGGLSAINTAAAGVNNFGTDEGRVASWVYHDPVADVGGRVGVKQYDASSGDPALWVKSNSVGDGFRFFVYYTVDDSFPEGAGGLGVGSTKAVELQYSHKEGDSDWWKTPGIRDFRGTFKYKVGAFKDREWGGGVASIWPGWQGAIDRKYSMLTLFEISSLDTRNIAYRPHNDYGEIRTGLPDGWHVIRGRAYLKRWGTSGRHASIYRTITQPFYLDNETPKGEIVFPSDDGDQVGGQGYDFVVRTDPTVTDVWYHIEDSDAGNDDAATRRWGGNGFGGEPFNDTNRNGRRDEGELFTDINANGSYDTSIGESWGKATRITASPSIQSEFPVEWRFNYQLIPPSGNARVRVRLIEASSDPRSNWTVGQSDSTLHSTTLERTVLARGPDQRFFIGWPQNDGDIVGPNYGLKVYFSPQMREGLSDAQLIEQMVIRIQSSESGRIKGGVIQNRDQYRIGYENGLQTLAFDLPNMYNGQPDWLHGIEVTFNRPNASSVTAARLVRAMVVPPPPRVDIVEPQEIGSDGRRIEIVLPELANPRPDDRTVPVTVRTDGPVGEVNLGLSFDIFPNGFVGGLALRPASADNPNPRIDGDGLLYDYEWSGVVEGQYRLRASVSKAGQTNSTVRNATVVFRQIVDFDLTGDSDDDGVPDTIESTVVPLPERNNETWTNGDVHVHILSGRTSAQRPDSDDGKLPDGLQLGLTGPINPSSTSLTADTDGDGFPNFLPDLDPPIYNTPGNVGYEQRLSRTDQIGGSVTDPTKPDTDEDGSEDYKEDLNRNGRVDIGVLGPEGKATTVIKHPNIPTDRNSSAVKRVLLPSNARFLETDPNSRDTDGDLLDDGLEDSNSNGKLDVFLQQQNGDRVAVDYVNRSHTDYAYNLASEDDNFVLTDNRPVQAIRSRALDYVKLLRNYSPSGDGERQVNGWPKLIFSESDPIREDTDGDTLPDGWESRYGLDALDNGVYNFRTGELGNVLNGANGDITGDGVTNRDHYLAGTDPRTTLTPGLPGGRNRITIGPGSTIGSIGPTTYYEEFMDWKETDVVVLDEYEGDGYNSQSGDIFPAYDQWDSSRDLTAFYARDGGDVSAGGDGLVYFRVDLDDLKAFAEQGHLDIYVVVNHTPGTGERVLPDDVDTATDMRWRAVIAVYGGGFGRVYVDTNPSNNTNNFGDSLSADRGIAVYDQSHPKGFKGAYFNSELDAVEFAIARQALRDGGWSGSDFSQLNFQVYTTKDGTGNTPVGAGDIGGRSDIRDSIYDDRITEDNYFAQAGREDVLKGRFGTATRPAAGRRAKLLLVAEENQPIRDASWIKDRLLSPDGAGYHRLIRAHEVFGAPLSLAITPTLASSLQWAESPDGGVRDGEEFNRRITALGKSGQLELVSVTFGGHLMPYTTEAFDRENIELAQMWLEGIYDLTPSSDTIYLAERTLDDKVLSRLDRLGFSATFSDQREHIEGWFGRTEALGRNGYRLNRVNGIDLLVGSDDLANFRFNNLDRGAPTQIRRSLSRKARNEEQQQVTILLSSLEDFRRSAAADGYDRNVRWYSNRPWVELVRPNDILSRGWAKVERGQRVLPMRSKDFVQYATLGGYDNWYYGLNGLREGLSSKRFDIRPGQPVGGEFGKIGTGGVSQMAWAAVSGISPDHPAGRLGRGVIGSGLFATAFHNQETVDLRKFSNGQYINQPRRMESLSDFSRIAQSGVRQANLYGRVVQWATGADDPRLRKTERLDVDLDGEFEYILYNNRIFILFEALGGRMTAGWLRNPRSGEVWQMVGNHISYNAFPDEREGVTNETSKKTSAFKDWYAQTSSTQGRGMADDLYAVEEIPNGFRFINGGISKSVVIDEGNKGKVEVRYTLTNLQKLFVRFGLSPNLEDLMINGQVNLREAVAEGGHRVELVNDNGASIVGVYVESSQLVKHNNAAEDRYGLFLGDTVLGRAQAQIHQVEFEVNGDGEEHMFTLGFDHLNEPPRDPFDEYMSSFFPGNSDPSVVGEDSDPDGDGLSNYSEFLWGSSPVSGNHQHPSSTTYSMNSSSGIFSIEFQTLAGRIYTVESTSDLLTWQQVIGGIVEGDGTRKIVSDNTANVSRRFYRVRVAMAPY
jgi:glycosidase